MIQTHSYRLDRLYLFGRFSFRSKSLTPTRHFADSLEVGDQLTDSGGSSAGERSLVCVQIDVLSGDNLSLLVLAQVLHHLVPQFIFAVPLEGCVVNLI